MTNDEWTDVDERVVCLIQLYQSDEVLYVMEETTTKGLRDKLESLYMGKSSSNKLHLKK